jgi:pyruvate ferredoxin oxidoreductase beta subunit
MDREEHMKLVNMENSPFVGGHTGCAGCGSAIGVNMVMRVIGRDVIVVNSTGCLEIISSKYPHSAWRVPYIHCLFENAASVATGISAYLRGAGNNHTQVVVLAGDGATYDIGFGCLSGMLERNDDVLYICYDNEAYQNTGYQRSSSTPFGAWTSTSQIGNILKGKQENKKPIVDIAAAHNIPYSASASIGFPADLEVKVEKARKIKGARFMSVHCPCVPGWGFASNQTVTMAKLAVETGMWPLYEVENGKLKVNYKSGRLKPVSEYLKYQKRYKHLLKPENRHLLKKLEGIIKDNWERLLRREKC